MTHAERKELSELAEKDLKTAWEIAIGELDDDQLKGVLEHLRNFHSGW